MRQNLVHKKSYLFIATIVSALLFLANSNNPPNGNTGAPGEGLCTSCHGSGNPGGFDGGVEIQNFPTNIVPGEVYPLTVRVYNPNQLANKAGFQMVILNETNQNFGSFSNPSSFCTITQSGGRTYVEHNPSQSFGSSDQVLWTVNWTAPSSGLAQQVKLYVSGNIANGNNSDNGDWIVSRLHTGNFQPQPDPLQIMMSSTNINCFGDNNGSASVQVTGGTPPYSYSWSNGGTTSTINNLSAGIYTVTVNDNAGQSITGNTEVIQPPTAVEVNIEALNTELNCDHNFLTIEAFGFGGIPPYTYLWNDGSTTASINVFTPGIYTVTFTDANMCSATASVTITSTPPPTASIDPVDPLCSSSNPVTLVATPAGGFFDGPGVNGNTFDPSTVSPGVHTVTYTLIINNCVIEDDIQIVVINTPSPTLTPVGPLCLNDTLVHLEASIGGGTWSGPGVINNAFHADLAGIGDKTVTYTVNIGGCISTTSMVITVVEPLPIVLPFLEVYCTTDDPVLLQATPTGGTWSGNGVVGNTFDPALAGPGGIIITYTLDNGCFATASMTVNVEDCGCTTPAHADAGPVITVGICQEIVLNGSVNTTATWTTNGDGTFESPNSPVTVYNAGPNDILSGLVAVTLTASDPDGDGPCSSFSSTTAIEIIKPYTYDSNIQSSYCVTDDTISFYLKPENGTFEGPGMNGNIFQPSEIGFGDYEIVYHYTDYFGCTATDTFNVAVVNCFCDLEAELNIKDVECFVDTDGEISISIIQEGVAPYTIEWSNGSTELGIQNIGPGNYSVTITDSEQCRVILSGAESSQPQIKTSIEKLYDNCDYNVCISQLQGSNAYTYTWPDGSTSPCFSLIDVPVSTIDIMITDGACSIIEQIEHTGFDTLNVIVEDMSPTANETSGFINITPTGGFGPYKTTWFKNNQEISSNEDLQNVSFGVYNVEVSDSKGCDKMFGPYEILNSMSNNTPLDKVHFMVYPNPTDNNIHISSSKAVEWNTIARLTSMNGETVHRILTLGDNGSASISVQDLPNGIYILSMTSGQSTWRHRIIIAK